jgi:hypothetical protein
MAIRILALFDCTTAKIVPPENADRRTVQRDRHQMHLTLDYISPMAFEKGLLGNQMAPDDECPCLLALECRLRLSGIVGALLNPFVRF